MEQSIYYRRNLPHYQPDNAIYFVTFRLANSLPQNIIDELKRENEFLQSKYNSENDNKVLLLYNQRKKYFGKFDKLLDGSSHGFLWLKNTKIAKIVTDAIHYRDNKEYKLYCFCIMPNHVHMVFGIGEDYVTPNAVSSNQITGSVYRVTQILQELKKFTAREANKILNRTGQFWHRESYDHVIRNANEFDSIVNYVMQNPVKAGLINDYKKWKWSFVNL